MNALQSCRSTSDAVPLYLPQHLFLKPLVRFNISLQLPNMRKLEKCVSHWEIMEKLRQLIKPEEFSVLKVSKTTVDLVRFEAELEQRRNLDRVLSKLDQNSIKLKDIPSVIRVKACEAKNDFPTRQKWDSFFQEAKDMDEMKPGERPDTLHLSNLPIKWFVAYHSQNDEDATPSEKIFYRIFEKFGPIRYVDVPICDPYRKKMKDHISGFKSHTSDDKDFFEGYVQFKDYIGFTKAVESLKDMKLVKKEDDEAFSIDFKVDFDRSKHMSDASIRRREIVRDRLVKKQRDKEEKEKDDLENKKKQENDERQKAVDSKSAKEKRRKEREAKRKAKILEKLKVNGSDELNEKIAKEEKKLLKAQRKLEAIRLVEELFRRIKEKKDELSAPAGAHLESKCGNKLKRYKDMTELEVLTQRQKLHHAIEGHVVLKTILTDKKKSRRDSTSSSDTSLSIENDHEQSIKNTPLNMVYEPPWYPYGYPPPLYAAPPIYQNDSFQHHLPGPSRKSRPFLRNRGNRYRRGSYRGGYRSRLTLEEQEFYSKHFSEHDRRSTSYNRSRRRHSRSRSRSKSRRRSRSRRRSYRSRSKTSSSKDRTRSRSWSMPRSNDRDRSRTWSKSRSRTADRR